MILLNPNLAKVINNIQFVRQFDPIKGADIQDTMELCKDEGISFEDFEHVLDELLEHGLVYEPILGKIKFVAELRVVAYMEGMVK